jgi:DnaJ-class molecular chaperone
MSWRDIDPDPIRPMDDTVAQDDQPEVITCPLCNGTGVRHIGDGLEFETLECTECDGTGLTEPRVS